MERVRVSSGGGVGREAEEGWETNIDGWQKVMECWFVGERVARAVEVCEKCPHVD